MTYHDPVDRFTLSSLLLGTIGLLLFIFPILSFPLSSVGLVFGLTGLFGALRASPRNWSTFRWPLGAIAISSVATIVSIAIGYAPLAGPLEKATQSGSMIMKWQPPSPTSYIPPPSLPL